jgi:glycosyltransferase involved in cell wall biosynthesis
MLTENIAEYLHIIDKPHIVIEGIYNSESNTEANDKVIKQKNETGKIAFLYTGGLNRRYGIVDLLEAFAKTMNNDFELWICGTGDSIDTIKGFAENDKRIKFFGTLPHDKVLTLQQQASFVVNPRHSNELFINYSFPSKTLEYMASGTPTLMCHLGCIPKEYEEHLLFFDDESIAGMTSKMEEVASMNKDELTLLGNGARQYILDYKNPKKQVERILRLVYNNL